jgi:hypothetical protein
LSLRVFVIIGWCWLGNLCVMLLFNGDTWCLLCVHLWIDVNFVRRVYSELHIETPWFWVSMLIRHNWMLRLSELHIYLILCLWFSGICCSQDPEKCGTICSGCPSWDRCSFFHCRWHPVKFKICCSIDWPI